MCICEVCACYCVCLAGVYKEDLAPEVIVDLRHIAQLWRKEVSDCHALILLLLLLHLLPRPLPASPATPSLHLPR